MKQRLFFLLKVFLLLLLVFLFGKIIFITVNSKGQGLSFTDLMWVLWHGFSLDVTVALYYLSIPFLTVLVSASWNKWYWMSFFLRVYFFIISLSVILAIVTDIVLYHYWGIKLDASVTQFLDTTGAAFISVPIWGLLGILVVITVGTFAIAQLLIITVPTLLPALSKAKQLCTTTILVLAIPLIVIGIRGGIGESTSNVGQVYFSQNQYLNHSAVNPVFSFFSSFSSTHQLPDHHFFDSSLCQQLTDSLFFTSDIPNDTLLNTLAPDIVMIIMEGCGSTFTMLNNHADVTPNLTKLAHEGVFFSNCYANSWRTDRGNVSILSGYPAFPNFSVMKITQKCGNLPSLARTLSEKNYFCRYIYGGDVNFTNTKGYLMATGFGEIISEKDFSQVERRGNPWGVNDGKVFDRAINIIAADRRSGRKSMNVVMTLSSHEPWSVPMNKVFDDEIFNAFHYLDRCIGQFVEKLKINGYWDNILLIILPDHGTRYKEHGYESPTTCRIPLIWTGGAIKGRKEISVLCNQSDLAATLLGQMGIKHSDFSFSRDVLSSSYLHHFASYSYTNHIALIDSQNCFHLYDLQDNRTKEDGCYRLAKALLQRACEDLKDR